MLTVTAFVPAAASWAEEGWIERSAAECQVAEIGLPAQLTAVFVANPDPERNTVTLVDPSIALAGLNEAKVGAG